jgi:hypothetical protein
MTGEKYLHLKNFILYFSRKTRNSWGHKRLSALGEQIVVQKKNKELQ